MAFIKRLKDNEDNTIYPITKTNVVVDNNDKTFSSSLSSAVYSSEASE